MVVDYGHQLVTYNKHNTDVDPINDLEVDNQILLVSKLELQLCYNGCTLNITQNTWQFDSNAVYSGWWEAWNPKFVILLLNSILGILLLLWQSFLG